MRLSDANLLAAVLLAPIIGSFMGVLIRRLPTGRPIAWARSACERCGQTLRPRDLVPILSFLALRGRCRQCGQTIAPIHLVAELAPLLIPLGAALCLRDPGLFWPACALGWTLLALALIDATSLLLPDLLTLPLIVAGLALTLASAPDQLADHALAAIVGYLSLSAVGLLYRRLRDREGLGGGDPKLYAAGGAWTGLAALPHVLLAASLLGLLAAGGSAAIGRRITTVTRLAFGPPLALAIWLVWLAGN